MNMASSIDGKIATSARGPIKFTSKVDSRRMAEIRAEHDLVINGASTFRAFPFPLMVKEKDLVRERLGLGHSAEPISAMVSSDLRVPMGSAWEKAHAQERWAFCGSKAPKSKVIALERAGVRVFKSLRSRPSAIEMMQRFRKEGIERVLLEGGGEFNASFFEKGLVDRIYLTLAPVLIGGAESPSFFEGIGFKKGKFPRYRLIECKNIRGELYLTYDKA